MEASKGETVTYYLGKFSWKMQENEEILVEGTLKHVPPLDLPMELPLTHEQRLPLCTS